MKKLSSVISSFERIGLTKPAHQLRLIQQLYKIAETDFSKEIEILEELAKLAAYFHNKSLKTFASEDMALPSYSIETKDKYIVFDRQPLSDYSKKEIYSIGIPDYLKNFVNLYMKNKLDSIQTPNARHRYERVIELLEDLNHDVKKTYKDLVKPVEFTEKDRKRVREMSKQAVDSELKKLSSVFSEMNQFETQVSEHYVYLLAHSFGGELQEGRYVQLEAEEEEEEGSGLLQRFRSQMREEHPDIDDDEFEDFEEIEEFEDDEEEASSPSKEQQELSILERIRKSSALDLTQGYQEVINRLSNLDRGFDEIRNRIDSKYAQQLGMDVDQFRKELGLKRLLRNQQVKISQMQDVRIREKIKLNEQNRKVTRDIINGKMGFDAVRPGKRKKEFHLYQPPQIFSAWESLRRKLAVRYEAFIKFAMNLYKTTKLKTPEELQEEREQILEEKTQELQEQMISTDHSVLNVLDNALNVLKGS